MRQKMAAAVEAQRAKVLTVRKLQDEGTKYVLEWNPRNPCTNARSTVMTKSCSSRRASNQR